MAHGQRVAASVQKARSRPRKALNRYSMPENMLRCWKKNIKWVEISYKNIA